MALAAEYEGELQILTLCPGITDTGFWKAAGVTAPRILVRSSEYVVEKALNSLGKKNLLIIWLRKPFQNFFFKGLFLMILF